MMPDVALKQMLNSGTDLDDNQVNQIMEMKTKAMDQGILDLKAIDQADFFDQDFLESMKKELNNQLLIQKELLQKKDVEFSPEPLTIDEEGSLFTEEALGQIFSELPFTQALGFVGQKFGEEQTRGYRLIAEEMGLDEDEIEDILG